jgi:hypothetical protein
MLSERSSRLIGYYKSMSEAGAQNPGGKKFDLMNIKKFRYVIRPLILAHRINSILDYGSGSCSWSASGFHGSQSALDYFSVEKICEYEPSLSKNHLEASDCVTCFDVLEHIPIEDVYSVVNELFLNSKKLLIVNIANYPARAVLPNGENCHITLRPFDWWKGVFDAVGSRHPGVNCFLSVSESFWQAKCSEIFSFNSTKARWHDSSLLLIR